MKNSNSFHISAQNIDCGYLLEPPRRGGSNENLQSMAQNIDCGYLLEPPRRGGSNENLQSMVLSRNKKINIYPCKPQFYCIKVGFMGVKTILACFRDVFSPSFSCLRKDMLRDCRKDMIREYGISWVSSVS